MIFIKYFVVSVAVLVIGIFVFYFTLFFTGFFMTHCEMVEDVKATKLAGVVMSKIDQTKDHNQHGLVIENEDREYTLNLTSDLHRGEEDQSYLWVKAEIGDSIFKMNGSFVVTLRKGNKIYKHEIVYPTNECE